MEAARVLPMAVADSLVFEETSDVRHAAIGGGIDALSGGTTTHQRIALTRASHLLTKLRSDPGKVFREIVKVRLAASREDIFYDPAVVVSCQPTGGQHQFVLLPPLIVEVLSPSTETTDRRRPLPLGKSGVRRILSSTTY